MSRRGGPAPGGPASALAPLRMIVVAFVTALLMLGFVLVMVTNAATQRRTVPPALTAGLAAAAIAGVAGAAWSQRRALPATSASALATTFRANVFVGAAFAEAPALLAFGVSIIVGRPWPYAIGLAGGLIGFAIVAPTASNVRRRQERITSEGSPLSLMDALTQPGRPDPP